MDADTAFFILSYLVFSIVAFGRYILIGVDCVHGSSMAALGLEGARDV